MGKYKLIAACAITCMLVSCSTAQETQLEKAFTAISEIDGFETFNREQIVELGWNEDDPRLSEELGEVMMALCGNADPREQFLAILEDIPAGMLYGETRDERDKITRYYTETDAMGIGYFLFTFVGWGGNDTVAMLYKGRDEGFYKALLDGDAD